MATTIKPKQQLLWRGSETVEQVRESLREDDTDRIEIQLATDYNHTLFARLHPESSANQPEELDVHGDSRILETLSTVRGLEEFTRLIEPLAAVDAVVHIVSPARVIIELPHRRTAER